MILKFSFYFESITITLPLFSGKTGDPITKLFNIDWGDGNITQNTTHTYLPQQDSSKIYTVIIVPYLFGKDFYKDMRLQFGALNWKGSYNLLAISQWGGYNIIALNYIGGLQLTGVPSTFAHTLESVDTSHMFDGATNFNDPNVSSWDVGYVNNMSYMFYACTGFNQSLNRWNVKSVINFSYMFYNAVYNNQQIGDWELGGNLPAGGMTNMFGPFRRIPA